MLGRLKMSIDDCIDAYLLLSDRIFQKKRQRVTVNGQIQLGRAGARGDGGRGGTRLIREYIAEGRVGQCM
jgi:hypothetical protein